MWNHCKRQHIHHERIQQSAPPFPETHSSPCLHQSLEWKGSAYLPDGSIYHLGLYSLHDGHRQRSFLVPIGRRYHRRTAHVGSGYLLLPAFVSAETQGRRRKEKAEKETSASQIRPDKKILHNAPLTEVCLPNRKDISGIRYHSVIQTLYSSGNGKSKGRRQNDTLINQAFTLPTVFNTEFHNDTSAVPSLPLLLSPSPVSSDKSLRDINSVPRPKASPTTWPKSTPFKRFLKQFLNRFLSKIHQSIKLSLSSECLAAFFFTHSLLVLA